MTDCSIPGSGGGVVAAKCGTLTVAENRSAAGSRSIGLYVAILPATSKASVQEPVFFIAGGPGGSTVEQWSQAASIFFGLNAHHDIVLVDQRGTGQSHQLMITPQNPGETPTEYAARALAAMDGDPRYYTTAVAMDDLDAVRQSLGYSKIDLYGGSYGATAVQYYIRQHGDHVHAAVLDGGTLIDVPILELIAANSQRALDDVFYRCLAEAACAQAFPNVGTEFATVLDRLRRAPVATDVQDAIGQPIDVTSDLFAGLIHQLMVISDSASIPWLVHQAWSGNFAEVAGQVTRAFPRSSPTPVMSIEIMCVEAWARHDSNQVSALGQGSYYLSSQLSWAQSMEASCSYVPPGYVPANDAQPVQTSLPILLLNGTDDPQDPPANVAMAREQMPNSLSVTPSGLGHTVGHIGCLPRLVARFFDTGKTDAAAAQACLATMPPPSFRLS
ncbi:MAG TPA: alpha/beta fold hydrolase [Candidatus Dormibacteraeota bacterium]|nr:alpha/beta fold hydrolase [Candidatus Dormibacteraeota bacterium]